MLFKNVLQVIPLYSKIKNYQVKESSILHFKELTFTWWSNCNKTYVFTKLESQVYISSHFSWEIAYSWLGWSLIEDTDTLKYDAPASKWNEIAIFSEGDSTSYGNHLTVKFVYSKPLITSWILSMGN